METEKERDRFESYYVRKVEKYVVNSENKGREGVGDNSNNLLQSVVWFTVLCNCKMSCLTN